MPDTAKSWWIPVWRGLIVEPTGKHYKRLRGALWLLLYFFLHAGHATGTVFCKVPSISRATGIPSGTIKRWLTRLRRGGYISTQNTGRSVLVRIGKWKAFPRRSKLSPQKDQIGPLRGIKNGPPGGSANGQKSLNGGRNSKTSRGPNDSTFTKVIIRNSNGRYKSLSSSRNSHPSKPRTREELLAQDLAIALGDPRNFKHYLAYARRYSESLLRRLLSEARAVPEREIKRSRAALFEYLLRQHARNGPQNPGR